MSASPIFVRVLYFVTLISIGYVISVSVIAKSAEQSFSSDQQGEQIYTLIADNEILQLQNLIDKTPDILNKQWTGGISMLQFASGYGSIKVVELLLEQNAKLDLIDEEGRTALHLAAMNSHEEIVLMLLEAGADSKIKDNYETLAEDLSELNSIRHYLQQPSKLTLLKPFYRFVESSFNTLDSKMIKELFDEYPELKEVRFESGGGLLHYKAMTGDSVGIKFLHSLGFNINDPDDYGRTPLIEAVRFGNKEVVEMLLSLNAKLLTKDNQGNSAFWYAEDSWDQDIKKLLNDKVFASMPQLDELKAALLKNKVSRVKRLLKKGSFDYSFVIHDNHSLLTLAVKQGMSDVVQIMVEKGASLSQTITTDGREQNPFAIAIANKDQVMLKTLLALRPEFLNDIEPIIIEALYTNDSDIFAALLANGFKPTNLSINPDLNRLVEAVDNFYSHESPNSELFKMLLDKVPLVFADIDNQHQLANGEPSQSIESQVNLFKVIEANNPKLLEVVLSKNPNLLIKNSRGNSPLLEALYQKERTLALMIIKHQPSLIEADVSESSLIETAIHLNRADIFELMTGTNKALSQFDALGSTIAHQLLAKQQPVLFELIESGLPVDLKDKQGQTLLIQAVKQFDVDAVKRLTKLGASTSAQDSLGNSALIYAVLSGNLKIFHKLLEKTSVNIENNEQRQAIHFAARQGYTDMVEALIDIGAKIDQSDAHHLLPWHYAFASGHSKIVALLVSKITKPKPCAKVCLYDDPLIQYINAQYLAGKTGIALALIEQELIANNNNPLLPNMWVSYHNRADQLSEAWKNASKKLQEKTKILTNIELSEMAGEKQALLKSYPIGYDFQRRDLMTLIGLAELAMEFEQRELQIDYLLKALELEPNFFQAVWSISSSNNLTRNMLSKISQVISQPSFELSLAKEYLSKFSKTPAMATMIQIEMRQKWLKQFPYDSRAAVALSYNMESAKYYQAALDYSTRGMVFSPLHSNYTQIAEYHLLLDNQLESQNYSRNLIQIIRLIKGTDIDKIDRHYTNLMGDNYREVGELSLAREQYQQGIQQWPGDYKNFYQLGEMERKAERYERAIELLTVAKTIKPNQQNIQTSLIKSLLAAEQLEASEKAIHQLSTRFGLNAQSYSLSLQLAKKQKNIDRLRELSESYSNNSSSLSSAIDLLEWFIDQEYFEQFLNSMQSLIKDVYLSETNANRIAKLLDRHPDIDPAELWKKAIPILVNPRAGHVAYVDTFISSKKDKINYWSALYKVNSETAYALDKLVNQLTGKQDWEAFYPLFESHGEALPSSFIDRENLSTFIVDYAWLIYQQSRRQKVDIKRVERSLAWLEDYKANYGSLSQYYRYQEYMFAASQKKEQAAEALANRSKYLRDSTAIFHDLIALYSGQNRDVGLRYGSQMIKRNPFSGSHSRSYLHKHVMWVGSPISALREIDRIKRLSIKNVSYDDMEKKALAALGDTLSGFNNYKTYQGVGSSQRYVDWFHRARESALFKDSKIINYDFNDSYNEVQIIDAEGFIKIRRDHPIYGRLTFAQSGASWVELEYTAMGKLKLLKTSNGKFVELFYNDKNNIVRMLDNEQRKLNFEYNSKNKPVRIDEEGVGSVVISYDKDNQVSLVRSEQGQRMALRITQAFQSLSGLTEIPKRFLRQGTLPDMPASGNLSNERKAAYEKKPSSKTFAEYISYLVDNVQSDKNYYQQARRLLEQKLADFQAAYQRQDLRNKQLDEVVFVATQWQLLLAKVKSKGLPLEDYAYWQKTVSLIKNISLNYSNKKLKKYLNRLNQTNIKLLKNANWLHKSSFVNQGYWHRFTNPIFRSSKVKTNPQAMLTRKNGDLLIGTSKGLLIHNGYYWRTLSYDLTSNSLVESESSNQTNFSVLSLAEKDGTLWIGTSDGLLKLQGGYSQPLVKLTKQTSAFQSRRIEILRVANNGLLVANSEGLYRLSTNDELFPLLKKVRVKDVLVSPNDSNSLLVSTSNGLSYIKNGQIVKQLSDKLVKSSVFINSDEVWYLTADSQVYRLFLSKPDMQAELIISKNDLTMSKNANSLALIPWSNGEKIPAVLTDLGINLYANNHIQFMQLPFKHQRQGLNIGALAARISDNGDLWLISEDGVYSYQPSRVKHFQGKVLAMAADNQLGALYVAMDNGIFLLDQNAALTERKLIKRFSSVKSNSLAIAANGDLYANDGFQILRYQRGDPNPQTLFNARANVEQDIKNWWQGNVRKLLIDSNNVLWVASGSSVWRWQEGKQPIEFNYSIDPEKFPSRSQMIFNIYEDNQKIIRVVASNENHIQYQGIPLSGGELIYKDNKFVRAEKEYRDGWFVSGYTPIKQDYSIIATGKEYYQEKNGRRNSFNQIASYKALKEDVPMLYLGGQGSRFSGESETWLFPSAGGLMTYHNNRWFYPGRLNQLLPKDAELGQYGGRNINGVTVDKNGRVYAGTDLGLMIYNAGDVESFLISQEQGNWIFVDRDNEHLTSLKNIFIDKLDPNSAQGKLISRIQKMETSIEQLETDVTNPSFANVQIDASSSAAESPQRDIQSLQKLLNQREKSRQRLLAKLEAEHYGLFQMLKLDPREAQQMGKKLAGNQVLVQYLPTPKSLYINVIENKQSNITEVPIGSEALYALVAKVSSGLRAKSELVRGIQVKQSSIKSPENLSEQLTLLYDWLLKPIEAQLENKKHVFISPVNQLTYLPFSSLIRKTNGRNQYAIERYNLGIIPSLYHLDLVLSHKPSFAVNELIAADPDGSLPGARKEISSIKRYLDAPVSLVGEKFSLGNLTSELADARIIHLATHGVLDSQSPADSYILLANGKRLDIPTIATMDLTQTELVVLSACETGIGKQGLELATLARAFALSNVPTVIASLWKVDDQSTAKLMTLFYRSYKENKDTVVAFSEAQRKMIKSEKAYSHPSDWSAFNVIGKP